MLGGALGFDATLGTAALWGAVGDVQFCDLAVSPQMAQGLYASQTAMCMPLPSSAAGITRAQLIANIVCSFIGFVALIGFVYHPIKARRPPPPSKVLHPEDA